MPWLSPNTVWFVARGPMMASGRWGVNANATLACFRLYLSYLGTSDLGEANAKLGYLFAVSSVQSYGTELGLPGRLSDVVLCLLIGTVMLAKVTEPLSYAAATRSDTPVEPARSARS